MTERKARKPHDSSLCGSPRNKGREGTCARPAGWGTTHPGEGRCKLHGGATPTKHGRYSAIKRPRLKELIEQFGSDPDPMNLLPEVVLLRALVLDYIERYDQFTTALIAWHADWMENRKSEKPTQVVDILSVGKFIGEIAGLVDKMDKQRQKGVLSLEAVNRYVEQLGVELVAAAQEAIPDGDTRTALFDVIDRRWATVAIDAKPGSKGPAEGPRG